MNDWKHKQNYKRFKNYSFLIHIPQKHEDKSKDLKIRKENTIRGEVKNITVLDGYGSINEQ